MNERTEFDLIYAKKLLGERLTAEENKVWQDYLQHYPGPQSWEGIDISLEEYIQLEKAKPEALRGFQLGFEARFGVPMRIETVEEERPVRRMRWTLTAVAAILLICAGGWLLYSLLHQKKGAEIAVVPVAPPKLDSIATPGGDSIILLLANQSKVYIKPRQQDGVVAQDSNWIISLRNDSLVYARAEGNMEGRQGYYAMLTPPGRQLGIVLPDSSRTALSPGSRLMIAASYGEQKREIELLGEGDFRVTHDSTRPFVVKTGNTITQALGTHFNVYSYPGDEYQDITLFEGIIQVSTQVQSNRTKTRRIDKREITRIRDTTISIYSSNEKSISIIEDRGKGLFSYTDTRLSTIMNDVERWYGVRVTNPWEMNLPYRFNLNGRSRRDPIGDILKDLQASRLVTLTLHKNEITVSKK